MAVGGLGRFFLSFGGAAFGFGVALGFGFCFCFGSDFGRAAPGT
jgi:hypothetical protein